MKHFLKRMALLAFGPVIVIGVGSTLIDRLIELHRYVLLRRYDNSAKQG